VNELEQIESGADVTIWEQAKAIHDANMKLDPKLPNFETLLQWYLTYGYVTKRPESVIMYHQAGNTWYIYLAIGKEAFINWHQQQPYYLEFISWGYINKKGKQIDFKMESKRLWRLLKAI